MQANRRKLGLLLIVIGLIIIILIIYFGFIRSVPEEEFFVPTPPDQTGQLPAEPEVIGTTPGDRPLNPQLYDLSREAAHEFDAEDLAKRAMLYAERLGSYSSQSEYSNFSDLKIYMTANMKAWVDQQVTILKEENRGGGYYGIETKALTSEVLSFNETAGTAEVLVLTERRESRENIGGGESFRQDINLRFVKSGDDWLISAAYWD